MAERAQDQWAQWLLERRHGGDEEQHERLLPKLAEFRERVVDGAEISEGDVVLDVGTGDGLIAFAALERVGASGQVIFSDVSADLLGECERLADELGVLERCEFVEASADALPFDAESVDVVTTRSVLIYLMEKEPAFAEFHRVLRPGGRLSIFEPINIFGHEQVRRLYYGFDVSPVQHLADKIIARWKGPEEHPLLNFDERDLFRFAREAGFEDIRMDYQAELKLQRWTKSWQTFLHSSGNPLDPTPEEEMIDVLDPGERAEFEAYVRPMLESEPLVPEWRAGAYLRAHKRSQ
jgi:ubiquinone/menaquinone biosynthesis C-methylase UbiE